MVLSLVLIFGLIECGEGSVGRGWVDVHDLMPCCTTAVGRRVGAVYRPNQILVSVEIV